MNEPRVMIELIKAAINGKTVPLPDDCDIQRLYAIASMHDIAGLVCYGIQDGEYDISAFKTARKKAMTRYMVQSTELMVLCDMFEKNGMFHMPLKGSVIRDIYPSPDMRTGSDIDIYIKTENVEAAKQLMLGQGYEYATADANVDAYEKKPLLYVELHREIDSDEENRPPCILSDYGGYIKTPGTEHRYGMSDEDMYEYLLWHFAKHLTGSGTGARCIVDLYLFNKKRKPDIGVLEENLKRDGLYDLYRAVVKLCSAWFEDGEYDENTAIFAGFIVSSGQFGTRKNAVTLTMASGKSKFGRLVQRVFPPLKEMSYHYPILMKAPVLLPFCYVIRPIQKLFSPAALKREMTALNSTDTADVEKVKKMLDSLGLK